MKKKITLKQKVKELQEDKEMLIEQLEESREEYRSIFRGTVKEAQELWRNKGSKGWKYVTDKHGYDWGPDGGINTNLSKLPDIKKEGKFTLIRKSCPPKIKEFKTIVDAIRCAYDEVVDRDSDDYRYILKGPGIRNKGRDIASFAWE